MIGGDGINDESNKTAPAPTRNTDLTKNTGVFPAACPGTMEAGAGLEADHDVQLPPAAVGVTEAHGPHLPR